MEKNMGSRSFEYVPDPKNPWNDDILDREKIGIMLTSFIESQTKPFVMSITSEFGTGKSVFIQRWVAHLRDKGFACIEFNAWTNDFSKEPLISFIGEINEYFFNKAQLFGENNSKAEQFLNKWTPMLKGLVNSAIPLVTKIASGKIIDNEGVADILKSEIEKSIKNYSSQKNSVNEFKNILTELANEVRLAKENQNPIVFVVDELDRCRPTYAIELLEVIKHFFNVSGFVFILAIDKNQILNSIRTQYGQGMDADGYLRRFIDLEYHLPELENLEFISLYCEDRYHAELLSTYSSFFSLSLRNTQQIIFRLNLILKISFRNRNNLTYLHYNILILLLCLESYNKDLYNEIIDQKYRVFDLMNKFFSIKPPDDNSYQNEVIQLGLGFLLIDDFGDDHSDFNAFITPWSSRRNHLLKEVNQSHNPNDKAEFVNLEIFIRCLAFYHNKFTLTRNSYRNKVKVLKNMRESIGTIASFRER